jgi:hypothetical protein
MAEPRQIEFVKSLTEHQTALRCFILSMLPGCQDVADVLQDANVELWKIGVRKIGVSGKIGVSVQILTDFLFSRLSRHATKSAH